MNKTAKSYIRLDIIIKLTILELVALLVSLVVSLVVQDSTRLLILLRLSLVSPAGTFIIYQYKRYTNNIHLMPLGRRLVLSSPLGISHTDFLRLALVASSPYFNRASNILIKSIICLSNIFYNLSSTYLVYPATSCIELYRAV